MDRLRAGQQDAASHIFERFAHRLIALARTRLDGVIRKKIDPEDVVQSVYRSFFVRFAEGQFVLESWDSLWAVLTVLTVRKCGRHIEHFRAARRDVYRELTPPPLSDDSHVSFQAIAREPTSEEALALTELVEELLRPLDGRNRDIVSLSLQGHKPAEIAGAVGCTERTVQRVLRRVKEWLEKRQEDGTTPRLES
jgi:RNA polymerase sigma-70 factor (ECF subfamily)